MVPIIDVVLIIIVAGFVFYGLFFGLIRMIGACFGMIIGAILASRFYLVAYDFVEPFLFGYNNLGKVITFLVLFSLISKLVSFAFYLADRAFSLLTIIPFLKTFNRAGGAIFGFLVGSLSVGLVLYVSSKYAIVDHWFGIWLIDSKVAPVLTGFAKILLPLLPEVLKKLKGLI
jgi:membrane protein required for colicin V production